MFDRIVRKQMKARYLIYFVLVGLFLGLFSSVLIHDASASTLQYSLGFESGYLVGQSIHESYLVSKNMKTTGSRWFNVSNVAPRGSSLYSFRLYGSHGFWNFTMNGNYLHNFSFWKRYIAIGGSASDTVFYFKDDLNRTINKYTIRSQTGVSTVYDDVGGVIYSQTVGFDGWWHYQFQYNSSTKAYFNMVGGVGDEDALHYPAELFTHIFVSSDGTSGDFSFDDFNTTFTTSYGAGTACNNFFDGVKRFGVDSVFCAQDVHQPVIEKLFNLPFTGSILGVDLPVNYAQYDDDPSLADYSLWVNGLGIGNPQCFFDNGYNRILRWELNRSLSNQYIILEFSHTSHTSYGRYWSIGTGCYSNEDLDGDGDMTYRYHSLLSSPDGVYSGTVVNWDLATSIYYDNSVFTNETSPYSDLVTCPKTAYNVFDTVPLYYLVSDYTYSNTIQLWHNGSQMMTQGYPYTIPSGSFNGELSFCPLLPGTYQFRLMRNGIKRSSFNITVTYPSDMDFVLYVIPNPVKSNVPVLVGYRYYPSDGMEGFIGVSEFSDTSNISGFSPRWVLTANTSGNMTFLTPIDVYVSMYKKIGSTYLLKHIVLLKIVSLFENTINVVYTSVSLSVGGSFVQRVYGVHDLNGFVVSIRINNKLIGYVTDTSFYSVTSTISKAGSYRADLCLETSNGSKVLCSVNFTVTIATGSSNQNPEAFDPTMKALFGICFVIVSVCVPLMISVKYHVNVPTFVYVIFMAFGIGLGTKLGFLDLWLVFLFVVALVAGAVYTIFGHGGPGPGTGQSSGGGTIRERVFTRRSGDEGVRKNGR